MLKRAFFVLPKSSSYSYKSYEEQSFIAKHVKTWENICKEAGLPIYCFAEDFLAISLLKENKDVKWIELLSDGDIAFLSSSGEDIPSEWINLEAEYLRKEYTREAVKKFPVDRCRDDKSGFQIRRMHTLRSRMRYVANKLIAEETMVVHFKNNNEFCNVPESKMGDGRLLITCDIARCFTLCELGGSIIPQDMVPQVIATMKV